MTKRTLTGRERHRLGKALESLIRAFPDETHEWLDPTMNDLIAAKKLEQELDIIGLGHHHVSHLRRALFGSLRSSGAAVTTGRLAHLEALILHLYRELDVPIPPIPNGD